MNEKIKHFKQQLARVFDDNLRTEQWQNYVDYAIMSLIGLSTLGIFLSTYDNIVAKYGLWLEIIDYFTLAVFTVEVTLRIWCADLIDDKYKGVWGRVRYCLSFYGLMDVLSTYTFYLALFFPIPYMTFKVLRVARLFRVFRYLKAFDVLARAIKSKKNEMLVSLQFHCIITLMLSFILYFVEHEAQPEVYDNGWTSVIWAFAQYIGDPGGFADTPPITFCGRIIACIIGVLGIAIFAVPAGLIGSAFTEVMEDDERQQNAEEWAKKLHLAFERKLDRPTGFQIAPRYVSIVDAQARLGLKGDEIMDAIAGDNHFRLINLAATQPAEMHPQDKLAVEHYVLNTPYGQCIDRGSKVTIFVPSGMIDPITGWWGYYLAKMGGFNFVCRELGEKRPYRTFYQYKPDQLDPISRIVWTTSIVCSAQKTIGCLFPWLPAVPTSRNTRPNSILAMGQKRETRPTMTRTSPSMTKKVLRRSTNRSHNYWKRNTTCKPTNSATTTIAQAHYSAAIWLQK